jgi:putative transcriptional regulator
MQFSGGTFAEFAERKEDNELVDDDWFAQRFNGYAPPRAKSEPLPVPQKLVLAKKRYPHWRLRSRLMPYRIGKKMSQAELAAKVGVTRSTISCIENDKHEPALSLALAITEVLQTPLQDLFILERPSFSGVDKPRYQRANRLMRRGRA